jgi:hypothetical protein
LSTIRLCLLALTLALTLRAEDNVAGNELAAVAACRAFAQAEEIYRRTDYDGDGILEYAQTIHGGKRLVVAAPDPAKLPKPSADEATQIGKLIKNLGSDEFSARESAAADLLKLGPKAYAQVQAAQSSEKDAEVVSRCRALVSQILETLTPERKPEMRNGLLVTTRNDGMEWQLALVDRAFALAECSLSADPKTLPARSGYLFRVLTRQKFPVERNYVVNGNMTLGYALLAFPKDYGTDGKKCFEISSTGVVFERDFGSKEKTDEFVKECDAFAPNAQDWKQSP